MREGTAANEDEDRHCKDESSIKQDEHTAQSDAVPFLWRTEM